MEVDQVQQERIQQERQFPGRDFHTYIGSMDKAQPAKVISLTSAFGPLPDKPKIFDIGSGTGEVIEAIGELYPGCEAYGVDRSQEFLELVDRQPKVKFIYNDARNLSHIPDDVADITYHHTIGHEIYSESGAVGLFQTLKEAHRCLKPGGREIWKDFMKPTFAGDVFMRIDAKGGLNNPEAATVDGYLDYSKLSTRALFDRFYEEFMGGKAFAYHTEVRDGAKYIVLPAEFAQEFILRKDYTANWRSEIKEKYTYWSRSEAKAFAEIVGFVGVEARAEDNPWIRENRIEGQVALFIESSSGKLTEVTFPTHMKIVMNKPMGDAGESPQPVKAADYAELISTVWIDDDAHVVYVGDCKFPVGKFIGQGAHKRVFVLETDPSTVLKIIRTDEPDIHNVFKSLMQAIERQQVLVDNHIPHTKIIDYDREGPPYRYIIQEKLPEGSKCAADLIKNRKLTETDIRQMAEIVNTFELGKRWQLDMNPFNWYRVSKPNGETQMVYIGSTVYSYDEQWTFAGKGGLLQWTDPQYVSVEGTLTAKFPKKPEIERILKKLSGPLTPDDGPLYYWKKFLSPAVFVDNASGISS